MNLNAPVAIGRCWSCFLVALAAATGSMEMLRISWAAARSFEQLKRKTVQAGLLAVNRSKSLLTNSCSPGGSLLMASN